ncbi:MAG: hypothetical protein CMH55_03460 [Myxococcales bacterium]|nr:hypothetical protein [Myxococcales bacterium]
MKWLPLYLFAIVPLAGCGPSFETLEGGFEPVQPKLDGSMFAYFRTVELDHTSSARPLPYGERDLKWLHLRFLGGVFDPALDYRFADFEAQSAAWDAFGEDRLFVDMSDLDTAGIPVTGLRYQRGLHKANVDQAPRCAPANVCIGSPLSDCPLDRHRDCLNGRVVFQTTLAVGRYSKQAIDTEAVPRRPMQPAAGASQDWEVTFDRLDEEAGGRISGEIGLTLERGHTQEGDIYRGQWKFRFDVPVISESLARCNESHHYGAIDGRYDESDCSAP